MIPSPNCSPHSTPKCVCCSPSKLITAPDQEAGGGMGASRQGEDLKENSKHTCVALALVTLSPQPMWPSGLPSPTPIPPGCLRGLLSMLSPCQGSWLALHGPKSSGPGEATGGPVSEVLLRPTEGKVLAFWGHRAKEGHDPRLQALGEHPGPG